MIAPPARHRYAAALAAATLIAGVGALAVNAAPARAAAAGPSVTVSPATGLDPDGASITVSGNGFATSGSGIYVALVDEAKFSPTNAAAFQATKWVHTNATPSQSVDLLADDGTFRTTLDVSAVFGTGGNTTDCTVDACEIVTIAAHGSPDRSQDTRTPVHFGVTTDPSTSPSSGTTTSPATTSPGTTSPGTTSPPKPGGPAVSVSPDSKLDPDGATLTVSGTGFPAAEPGIYVGIASRSRFDPTSADTFGATTWVHPGGSASAGQGVLTSDGSFEITLTVTATFGSGQFATDCLRTQCAIVTVAAHGSSDRSQDTATDLAFLGADVQPDPTASSAAPTTSPEAHGSLSKSTVVPGGSITLSATGFEASEQVQAVLHSDPIDLGIHRSDAAGTLRLTFTVPTDLSPGAHAVELLGLSSGQRVSVPLTVIEAARGDADETVIAGDAAASTALAATGSDTSGAVVLALVLVFAGVGLLVLASRRPRAH